MIAHDGAMAVPVVLSIPFSGRFCSACSCRGMNRWTVSVLLYHIQEKSKSFLFHLSLFRRRRFVEIYLLPVPGRKESISSVAYHLMKRPCFGRNNLLQTRSSGCIMRIMLMNKRVTEQMTAFPVTNQGDEVVFMGKKTVLGMPVYVFYITYKNLLTAQT